MGLMCLMKCKTKLISQTLSVSATIQNGEFDMGLEIYLDMMRSGLRPNEATAFLAVLGKRALFWELMNLISVFMVFL
jgi:pentatricopeptide repeat protein